MWGKSTMYEESAGIPLILAGPDVPAGNVCATPVSLVDGFQTFIQALGAQADPRDASLPGHSLLDIAQGYVPKRTILSEYHAAGAMTGSYMIRHGRYKYIHYVGLPPMLFDLEADPDERNDLGRDPALRARSCANAKRGCARSSIRSGRRAGARRPARAHREARRQGRDPEARHVPLFAAARGRSASYF